jgi:phosphate starvation-inducible PhoH-like protein
MAKAKLKDTSPKVPQRDKLNFGLNIRERDDLTEKQKTIISCGFDKNIKCIFIDGIYGSSKTWCSVLVGLKLLNSKRIDQIIYIRNPVESSTTGKIGFLKGEKEDKMSPYARPMEEKLEEFLSLGEVNKLKNDERVECIPVGFVRGRSWNCKCIIVDEAACLTKDDIILLMSRVGEFSKIFFIGDSRNQNDIGSKSGFREMFNLFNDEESKNNGVFCFEMKDAADIVRSGFVRFVMSKIQGIN